MMECRAEGIVSYVALSDINEGPVLSGEEQSSQLLPLISFFMGRAAWD